MPYKAKIEGLEYQMALLERELDDLRDKQAKHEDKEVFYIIEEGIDSFGDPYLICEEVPASYDLTDIDSDIEVERENSEMNEFKACSFRLSTKREEEYGLY